LNRIATIAFFTTLASTSAIGQGTTSGCAGYGCGDSGGNGNYVSNVQLAQQAQGFRNTATSLRLQVASQTGAARACTLALAAYYDNESNQLQGLGGYTTPAMVAARLASVSKPVCSGGTGSLGGLTIPNSGASTKAQAYGDLGFGVFSDIVNHFMNEDDTPAVPAGPTPEQIAAQQAAAEAARRQQIQREAADIVNSANDAVANSAPDPAPAPSVSSQLNSILGGPSAPNASAAVNDLLSATPPNSSAIINDLLNQTAQPGSPCAAQSQAYSNAGGMSQQATQDLANCISQNAPTQPPSATTNQQTQPPCVIDYNTTPSTATPCSNLGIPTTLTFKDGTSTATYPDGTVTITGPNGATTVVKPVSPSKQP